MENRNIRKIKRVEKKVAEHGEYITILMDIEKDKLEEKGYKIQLVGDIKHEGLDSHVYFVNEK